MANEMRDRLKENISIIKQHNERGLPVKHITKGQKYEAEVIAEIVEDVSLIIEKMENKTLVDIPCKVGCMVYSFCETLGVVLPYFVENLHIAYYDENREVYQYEANCTNDEGSELLDSIDFEIDDIGKTVFFTRKEAEQKLKEMRGVNG